MTSNNIKSWPPQLTVAAIIHRHDKFLIVEEHANGRIVLNQPAGHVEPGEKIVTAVKRETLEETAWQFQPEALIGIYLFTVPETGVTYQRFCFTGYISEHDANRKLDNGIIQTHWLTRHELVQQKEKLRSPMVLRSIDDFLANKRFPLNLINDL